MLWPHNFGWPGIQRELRTFDSKCCWWIFIYLLFLLQGLASETSARSSLRGWLGGIFETSARSSLGGMLSLSFLGVSSKSVSAGSTGLGCARCGYQSGFVSNSTGTFSSSLSTKRVSPWATNFFTADSTSAEPNSKGRVCNWSGCCSCKEPGPPKNSE